MGLVPTERALPVAAGIEGFSSAAGLPVSLPARREITVPKSALSCCCSAFMLVGARHKCSVGEVQSAYQDEVGILEVTFLPHMSSLVTLQDIYGCSLATL